MKKPLLAVFMPLLTLTLAACNRGSNEVAAASSEPSPAPPAAGQDSSPESIQIRVNSTHRSYACHNSADAVQVTGSSDVLTITGNCGSLQVTGQIRLPRRSHCDVRQISSYRFRNPHCCKTTFQPGADQMIVILCL